MAWDPDPERQTAGGRAEVRRPNLFWAETQNPYGPARKRRLRIMQVQADGKTVQTTQTVPAGWPADTDNGKKESFAVTLLPGPPKQLRVEQGANIELFDEGAWSPPTTGLTAIVRAFSATGAMAKAFCEASSLTAPNRAVIWEFARSKSTEIALAEDIVAGAPLSKWTDPTGLNQFAITNVPGFDKNGGTELSDQFNFIVLYLGTVTHPLEPSRSVKRTTWSATGSGCFSEPTSAAPTPTTSFWRCTAMPRRISPSTHLPPTSRPRICRSKR